MEIPITKKTEAESQLALSSSDCTPYSFVYSGDVKWSSALSAANLTAGAVELTRTDVAAAVYPTYYNNSFPNPGLLSCFCLHLSGSKHASDAPFVEFLNPFTNEIELLCTDVFQSYASIQLWSILAVLSVVIVNEVLKEGFRKLVAFEGHETRTEEVLAHTVKLFGSMLMNTAMIVVLISGNLALFTNGRQHESLSHLERANILSGMLYIRLIQSSFFLFPIQTSK
jgi:hypothetical protein